ncbi:MAG: methionyl-tRNA formyltransferase, partial [Paludibacteraceae bacterium]|nr:methionyl-tRNA formyltransferase [Paludibacteraceae bacterium]
DMTTAPGSIETDGKTYMKVATKDGYIHLDEVQLAGKKRMAVRDMLNGLKK